MADVVARRATPINNPLHAWHEAINQPGAAQMQHGRALIESRPFLTRIPDAEIIVTGRVPTSVPGAGRYRFVATRDDDGTYAMVYAPVGRKFTVRMVKGAGVNRPGGSIRGTAQAKAIDPFDQGERSSTRPTRAR